MYKEIKPLRDKLLIEQNNICLLCGQPITNGEEVLDHIHKKPHNIRGVLHRACNLALGKFEGAIQRNKITPEQLIGICNNLIDYIHIQREEVHPISTRKRRATSKKKNP